MASLKYFKDIKRWRVFWHVTLPDGEVDKGSKSFKTKQEGLRFKTHCENKANLLKRARVIDQVLLTDALDEWTAFLQGYTQQTRDLYSRYVKTFIEYLPEDIIFITDLTKNQITSFLNSRMSQGLKNKTVNNYMVAVKSLCRFTHENYSIANPSAGIKKLKEDPPEVKFLTREEYMEILKNCNNFARGWIKFLANTGFRATEFCELKWGKCDLDRKTITVVGKGRKKRTIGLNRVVLGVMEEIKAGRRVKANDPVFLTKNGNPVSRNSLYS